MVCILLSQSYMVCVCLHHLCHLIVQEIGISTRTGRDPDNSVIVPEDPKPHLWTMAWKGIKWITNKFWEGVRTLFCVL